MRRKEEEEEEEEEEGGGGGGRRRRRRRRRRKDAVAVKEVEEGSWKGRNGCGDEDREREVM